VIECKGKREECRRGAGNKSFFVKIGADEKLQEQIL
jgi:hypothetical protein